MIINCQSIIIIHCIDFIDYILAVDLKGQTYPMVVHVSESPPNNDVSWNKQVGGLSIYTSQCYLDKIKCYIIMVTSALNICVYCLPSTHAFTVV